jgi:hypothetical protein
VGSRGAEEFGCAGWYLTPRLRRRARSSENRLRTQGGASSSVDIAYSALVTPSPAPTGESFDLGLDEHCRHVVLGLRAALLELYGAVGADPDRPQEVSRQFKLDKSLTWKVSKILRSEDAIDVVSLIPGTEGLTRLLNAMSTAGASEAATSRVRTAMRDFEAMVERHAGDRATLDLFLDSMRPSASMQESRRLAYLGNSGILGLQTRVRFATRFIAPNRQQPDRLDFALVTGVRDLRRLRPTATWPIYRFTQFKDDLTAVAFSRELKPLESQGDGSSADWLMPSWCSTPIPPIRVSQHGGSVVYELLEGPVGRTGETDLTFGYLDERSVSRYATEADQHGHFATGLTTPAEAMLIDFFVHRSLPEVEQMTPRIVTQIPGFAGDSGLAELPIALRFTRLTGRSPQAATQLIADYHRLVARVFEQCHWDAADFYGLRMIIDHPPLNATVLTSYDLPTSPGEALAGC